MIVFLLIPHSKMFILKSVDQLSAPSIETRRIGHCLLEKVDQWCGKGYNQEKQGDQNDTTKTKPIQLVGQSEEQTSVKTDPLARQDQTEWFRAAFSSTLRRITMTN